MTPTPPPLDVIGDLHGEKAALFALGKKLGYDDQFHHPDGRIPVFIGDLVDRGAHSLELVELVMRLVEEGRGACLMGNHEYNLVAYAQRLPGYEKPKGSNRATIESWPKERPRWDRALAFLRTLPLAFELPDLRVIHACWHLPSFEKVRPVLGARGPVRAGGALAAYVALETPFDEHGLKPGLEYGEGEDGEDSPTELLIKGFEVDAEEPFHDTEGTLRTKKRATWWLDAREAVPLDRPLVIGHYWNLPPVDGDFCPPHPSGHPLLRAWRNGVLPRVPDEGRVPFEGTVACVDFNGVTAGSKDGKACAGALRWPEREIVWASAPRTRSVGKHDA